MKSEESIKKYAANAIRSLYQMILEINDETMAVHVEDHNNELKNISVKDDFEGFCRELYKNIHPEDREGFKAFTEPGRIRKELKKKIHVSFECRIKHSNKRYYWSEIIFCNASNEDLPKGHEFLFLIRDIHDRKVKELKDEAEQRWILKDLQDRYDRLFEENMKDEQTGCYNRKGMHYYTDMILDEAQNT